MIIQKLILPDVDHYDISGIVEQFIISHELPVVIVSYTHPDILDQVFQVVYKRGYSTVMRKQGDIVEISVA